MVGLTLRYGYGYATPTATLRYGYATATLFTHRELHTKNTSSTCLHLDRIQYKHFHMTLGDTYYNDTHMDPEWKYPGTLSAHCVG